MACNNFPVDSADDTSVSHRGSNFSLASAESSIVDGIDLTYYPDSLDVKNAGLFSGVYHRIKFRANGAPRYKSEFIDSVGDYHFIYKNKDSCWWFAVGEHQVLMNGGAYKTRFPAKQPHLHSAKWLQHAVTYKNQNSQEDPYWVGYPQMEILDTTNTGEDDIEEREKIGETKMMSTKICNDSDGESYSEESTTSQNSVTRNLNRISREQSHAIEAKYHTSIGRTAKGTPIVDLLIEAGLAHSIADARRCIRLRLTYFDEELIEDIDYIWIDNAYGDYILEVTDRGKAVIELIENIARPAEWEVASRNFRFKRVPKVTADVEVVRNKSAALLRFEENAKNARKLDESYDLW